MGRFPCVRLSQICPPQIPSEKCNFSTDSIIIFVLLRINILMEGIMSVLPERVRQRQRETQADIERHIEKGKDRLFIFDEIKKNLNFFEIINR